MSLPACDHCGAPHQAGLLVCRFCRSPHSPDATQHGVPCPNCGLLHERSAQKCASCAAWLVIQCIFCGSLSPYREAACRKCREPFAGAQERRTQRLQEEESRRQMQMVSNVGGAAVSVLGAIAGTGIVGQVADAVRSDDDGVREAPSRRNRRHRNDDNGGGVGGFLSELLSDTDPSDDGG